MEPAVKRFLVQRCDRGCRGSMQRSECVPGIVLWALVHPSVNSGRCTGRGELTHGAGVVFGPAGSHVIHVPGHHRSGAQVDIRIPMNSLDRVALGGEEWIGYLSLDIGRQQQHLRGFAYLSVLRRDALDGRVGTSLSIFWSGHAAREANAIWVGLKSALSEDVLSGC